MSDLNIPEKLFILSIDDNQGEVASFAKSTLCYGLAGGVLAELAMANKIQLVDNHLVVVDAASLPDPLLHATLATIAGEQKPHRLGKWIEKIGNKKFFNHVAARLAEHGVVSIEEQRILWVFPNNVYPQKDASVKYWVKEHLRGIVLADQQTETGDIALLSLLVACNMLRLVFTRDERKAASKKIEGIVKVEVFGEAVAQLLRDIEIATAATIAVAGVAST